MHSRTPTHPSTCPPAHPLTHHHPHHHNHHNHHHNHNHTHTQARMKHSQLFSWGGSCLGAAFYETLKPCFGVEVILPSTERNLLRDCRRVSSSPSASRAWEPMTRWHTPSAHVCMCHVCMHASPTSTELRSVGSYPKGFKLFRSPLALDPAKPKMEYQK